VNKVIKNSLSLLILFTAVTVVNASDDAEMAAVGAAARDMMVRPLSRVATGAISPSVTAARAADGDAVAASELVITNPRVAELESALAAAQTELKKAQAAGKWQLVFHKMARKNLACKMRADSLRLTEENTGLRAQVASLSIDSKLGALTGEEASVAADLLRAPMMPGALRREMSVGFDHSVSGAGDARRRVKIVGAGAGLPSDSDSEGSIGAGASSAGGERASKRATRIAELERELATRESSVAAENSLRNHGGVQAAALTAALATGAMIGVKMAGRMADGR